MRLTKLVPIFAILAACSETQDSAPEEVGESEQALQPFAFSTHEILDPLPSFGGNTQRGTDPFVALAENGDVYVGATGHPVHPLITTGGSLWRSTNDGAAWGFLGTAGFPVPLGLEPAMHIDSSGRLWMAEFYLAGPEQIFRYSDPSAIVNRATDYDGIGLGAPPGERPWVSSFGDRVHVQYGETLFEPGVRISFDGAANPPVFTATIPIAVNPALRAEVIGGTNTETTVAAIGQGPMVVNQTTGRMCAPLVTMNGASNDPYLPAHSLWTACSDDGLTWTNTLVYNNPNVALANLWPASAIDSDGNMFFIVAANMKKSGAVAPGMNIYLFSSKDDGLTWSAPKKVNQTGGTHIFPEAVAGCNGDIDIVWYGTDVKGNPSTLPATAEWTVFMAQSRNAKKADPEWLQTDVASSVVHYGPRNHKGSFNNGVDYRVISKPGLALDADGAAHVVWQDTSSPWSLNPAAAPIAAYMGNPTFSLLSHSKQVAGRKLEVCP